MSVILRWMTKCLRIIGYGLYFVVWGMNIFTNDFTAFSNGLLRLSIDNSHGADIVDDLVSVLVQRDGASSEVSDGDLSSSVLDQRNGASSEVSEGDVPLPVLDHRDERTTAKVGCFYAFYFSNFSSENIRNLKDWRNDYNSISQIISFTDVKVGHCTERRNLTKKEFEDFLEKVSSSREASADYLFFYLLSHGKEEEKGGNKRDCIITSDNLCVPIMEIIKYFGEKRCKRFKDKPKIFVFQCCRGSSAQKSHLPTNELSHIPQNNGMECIPLSSWGKDRVRRQLDNSTFIDCVFIPYHTADNPLRQGSSFEKHLRDVISSHSSLHPAQALDEQGVRNTVKKGCFYAFYFWSFPSTEDNHDHGGQDQNSISHIVQSNGLTIDTLVEQRNLRKEEFLSFLKEISSCEESADYLFFYLLSHGKEGNKRDNIITRDNYCVPFIDIIKHFGENVCQRFKDKPKIFVFQSCYGKFYNRLNSENLQIRRTLKNNMFVAYAATPGYCAYDTDEGSVFTRYLREVILDHGKKEDINMIMTRVNRLMSRDTLMCQMSVFVSRLTEEFKFYTRTSHDTSSFTDVPSDSIILLS